MNTDWQNVAAALNTELTAERELRQKAEADLFNSANIAAENVKLAQQLAAERETASRKATQSKEAHFTPEKHHPSCSAHDSDLVWHCSQCGVNESAADIEEQLAAEREKAGQECDLHLAAIEEARQLRDQLAAERRIRYQLRDELVAERKKVQTLVDALERIRDSDDVTVGVLAIADAALAKVKEGK